MTAQNFENIFQKISLSMSVQEAFRGTEVRKLTIHKKERTVSMEIAAKELIPLQKWDDLRQELLKNLPGIREVDIDITYELEENTPEQLAEGYWESIQTFVSQQSKVCAGVISDAEWKIVDGKMQIFVKNNMAYYLSQKHLDDAIMKMIETETGQRLLVQFKNVQTSAEERALLEQQQEQKLLELSQKIVSSQNDVVQEKANAEAAAVSSSVAKGKQRRYISLREQDGECDRDGSYLLLL